MKNLEGNRVPDVTFKTRTPEATWKDVTTNDLFAGKTVVVFSLPGAFTPTCSTAHVPRYNELAPVLKQHGVDDIICISVNDAFVMNEWKVDQGADRLTFVPDGNGEFSKGMGMLVDKRVVGFGERSWRYSMLVKDGVIAKMFIEPEKAGDPFEVSDADTMLGYLAPKAAKPLDVVLFTKPGCSYCAKAKAILTERKIDFVDVASTPRILRAVSGKASTPQVFINGAFIGGADELEAHLRG